jgi:dipeptidyl aminopeptidase/acylaminoacyl peptidase
MTPELLWSLGRVTPEMVTPDGRSVVFGVTYFDLTTGKGERNLFTVGIERGAPVQITKETGSESNVLVMPNNKLGYVFKGELYEAEWDGTNAQSKLKTDGDLNNVRISPDGKYILFTRDVKLEAVLAADYHPDLNTSTARIYNSLNYRHWDTWEDGAYSHVFFADYDNGAISNPVDIMPTDKYDSPQMPFGGTEDVVWHPNSKHIIYVTKKETGTAYTISTNTDIFSYNIETGKTTNLTTGMMGYDTYPTLSEDGSKMILLSMERAGYEADKNRLYYLDFEANKKIDLSTGFDETIDAIAWSSNGSKIYFTSPKGGTIQLYEMDVQKAVSTNGGKDAVRQLTTGDFDITNLIGEANGMMVVTRTDMNHAAELYRVNLTTGEMQQITYINKPLYDKIKMSQVDKTYIKTTDEKDMLAWIIYPPDFDPSKKYPTLLYCQGGPQSALTQFYSYRWNFQLMAANGYIVVAPNRRGMPGHGAEWNQSISGEWGGQVIRDYLSAIDYAKTLPGVDANRCGAIGASYGGYSVYMLAGIHNGRFKSFIAHDGLFNLPAFYGTTDEMWFANWDMGSAYWDNPSSKSYTEYNPMTHVNKWNTPILIYQGGKDYRTTEDQAFQAFQAAQLRGIKSRFVYLSDENHWVLQPHNALVWQREFYKWLQETL